MRRLSLDDNDAKARTWFVEETRSLGCSQHVVDEVSLARYLSNVNIGLFNRLLGLAFRWVTYSPFERGGKQDPLLQWEVTWIHNLVLEADMMECEYTFTRKPSQLPGILTAFTLLSLRLAMLILFLLFRLGIHAGIEALRVLEENKIETEFPVCVVNWTNEEGARFPRSVMSSSVWAGLISVKEAWNLKEVPALAQGKELKSVKEELKRIGWFGETRCDHKEMPLGAHFELHIEQGPILEREGKTIGVVTGGQAYRWFTLSVRGREAHTGTTPFADRSDALQASARIIVASREIAKQHGGLCTTGILSLQPGSTNTIPGAVNFSLDIRHPKNEDVVKIEEALRVEVDRIVAEEGNCEAQWSMDTDSKAVDFHPDCIQAVRESAEEAVGSEKWIEMRSGAGHDR